MLLLQVMVKVTLKPSGLGQGTTTPKLPGMRKRQEVLLDGVARCMDGCPPWIHVHVDGCFDTTMAAMSSGMYGWMSSLDNGTMAAIVLWLHERSGHE